MLTIQFCLGTSLVLTEIFLHGGIYSCLVPFLLGLCIVFRLSTEFWDKMVVVCTQKDHKTDTTKQVRLTKNFVTIGNFIPNHSSTEE
jgi:hypothetical protein